MVNAKELRLGNLVKCLVHLQVGYYKPTLAYSQVIGIRETEVQTDLGVFKYKEIDDITLTENILLKAGAKQNDNKFIFGDGNTDKLTITLVLTSGKFYLGGDNEKIYSVSVNAVHQLQNLYFDLRKEELDLDI